MQRVINFSAGPSSIPLDVLQMAQKEFLNYNGMGFSIIEISHRSKVFEEVLNSAIENVRELYKIPDNFAILFLQGGATLQFSQVPMNLSKGGFAEYVNTGVWTQKAIKEAKILGIDVRVVSSSEDDEFSYIPEFSFSDNADYAYICSNNTIYGTQYKHLPTTKCPLVVDSSSDLLSREVDFNGNIGLFYGGIQKNAGPSGVTLVIVNKSLVKDNIDRVPTLLQYNSQIKNNSMLNTPNTFGIYMFNLTTKWIKKQGGLSCIHQNNINKAKILYDFIDNSNGFYRCHARKDSRSLMNVSFNIIKDGQKSVELEKEFVYMAEKDGMIGLKGHRILGGIRASIYNAISLEDVKKLVEFMHKFQRSY